MTKKKLTAIKKKKLTKNFEDDLWVLPLETIHSNYKNEVKKAPKDFVSSISKSIIGTKKHFDKDKWDLDLDFLVDDYLQEYMGFNYRDAILSLIYKKLGRKDMEIEYSMNHDTLRISKKKK